MPEENDGKELLLMRKLDDSNVPKKTRVFDPDLQVRVCLSVICYWVGLYSDILLFLSQPLMNNQTTECDVNARSPRDSAMGSSTSSSTELPVVETADYINCNAPPLSQQEPTAVEMTSQTESDHPPAEAVTAGNGDVTPIIKNTSALSQESGIGSAPSSIGPYCLVTNPDGVTSSTPSKVAEEVSGKEGARDVPMSDTKLAELFVDNDEIFQDEVAQVPIDLPLSKEFLSSLTLESFEPPPPSHPPLARTLSQEALNPHPSLSSPYPDPLQQLQQHLKEAGPATPIQDIPAPISARCDAAPQPISEPPSLTSLDYLCLNSNL